MAFSFCGSFQPCLPSAFPVEEIASTTRWCCFPDSIHPTISSVVAWSFPDVLSLPILFVSGLIFCINLFIWRDLSGSLFSPLICLVSFVCLQFPFYLREPVLPCVRALCFPREHISASVPRLTETPCCLSAAVACSSGCSPG